MYPLPKLDPDYEPDTRHFVNGLMESKGTLERQTLIQSYNAPNITITIGGVIERQDTSLVILFKNTSSMHQSSYVNKKIFFKIEIYRDRLLHGA